MPIPWCCWNIYKNVPSLSVIVAGMKQYPRFCSQMASLILVIRKHSDVHERCALENCFPWAPLCSHPKGMGHHTSSQCSENRWEWAPLTQQLENGPPEETGVTPVLSSSKFFNILFIRDFFVLLFIVNILHLKIPHLDYWVPPTFLHPGECLTLLHLLQALLKKVRT